MRLYIIRHGDPDYVTDSLTQKGQGEAAALADYLPGFTSPTCTPRRLAGPEKPAATQQRSLACL